MYLEQLFLGGNKAVWIKTWQLTGSELMVHIEFMGMSHSVDIVPPSSHEAVALLHNSLGRITPSQLILEQKGNHHG